MYLLFGIPLIIGVGETLRIYFPLSPIEGYRLLALDLPGHGHSEGKAEINIKEYSRFIADFIQTLDFHSIILVEMVPSAGHMSMQENPVEVNKIIIEFLKNFV